MFDPWMPGAFRMRAYTDGGPQARTVRAVWVASGLDDSYSARLTARRYNHLAMPPHLIWEPSSGDLVQMIPADRRGLLRPLQARTEAIQIVVCSPPGEPWTAGPCEGLPEIMEWLRGHGIPDAAPLGPPTPSMSAPGNRPGHYCINSGVIDYERLFRSRA